MSGSVSSSLNVCCQKGERQLMCELTQNLCSKNSPPIGSDPLTTVCESQKHEQDRVEGAHQCSIQTFPVVASSGWQRTHHGFRALNVPPTWMLLRATQWSVILVSQRDRGRVFLSQRQWHGHAWDRCGPPMTVNIKAEGLLVRSG